MDFYRCPNKPIIYYKGYEPGCGQRESGLEWARTYSYLPCITKSSMREKSSGVCEILLQLLECRYLAKNLSWAQWAPSPIDRLTAKAALSHQRSKRMGNHHSVDFGMSMSPVSPSDFGQNIQPRSRGPRPHCKDVNFLCKKHKIRCRVRVLQSQTYRKRLYPG